jgi:hypothetical protein
MSVTRPLMSSGKPLRALRALADTNPAEPLTEYGVWSATGRNGGAWWSALATLVARGLAERTGRTGGYEWFITDAGRALLAEQEPTGGEG